MVPMATKEPGVSGFVADQNLEMLTFSGATSDYTYQQAGNALKVYSGNTLVATVWLQPDSTQLTFSNVTVDVTLDTSASSPTFGKITFGGAVVSDSVPTSLTPTTTGNTQTSGSSGNDQQSGGIQNDSMDNIRKVIREVIKNDNPGSNEVKAILAATGFNSAIAAQSLTDGNDTYTAISGSTGVAVNGDIGNDTIIGSSGND